MAVWGGLTNSCEKKRSEKQSKGEKERYKHLNAEFQRIARRDKKAFFSDQCKELDYITFIFISMLNSALSVDWCHQESLECRERRMVM